MSATAPFEAEDEYLLTAEVAAITRVSEPTLRRWRNSKNDPGPRSIKHGPKLVVYRRSEVTRWLAEQEANSVAS